MSNSAPSQTQAAPDVDTPMSRARESRLEAVRKAGVDPNAPKLDVETVLKQSARPAPEDSEFAVALTDNLVERRTFHSHPTLVKAEKITVGGSKTLRVTTRDGHVLTAPGDSVPSLSTASSGAILKAVGIDGTASRMTEKKPRSKAEN